MILFDVDRWDRASDAEQDAAIEDVYRRIALHFKHVRTERFTGRQHRESRWDCTACNGLGGRAMQSGNSDFDDCDVCLNRHQIEEIFDSDPVSHRVAIFRYGNSGVEFVLVPGRLDILPCLVGRTPYTKRQTRRGMRPITPSEREHAVARAGVFDLSFNTGTWMTHPFGLEGGNEPRPACSIPGLEVAHADAFHRLADELGPIDKFMPEGCAGRTGYGTAIGVTEVLAIGISADGRWIAAGSQDDVRISDVSTGRQISRLATEIVEPSSLSFSPNGLRLAVCSSAALEIYEVATGEKVAIPTAVPAERMTRPADQFRAVHWCPDGRLLVAEATRQEGKLASLRFVDPETTETSRQIKWEFDESKPSQAAFAASNDYVALSLRHEGNLVVRDARTLDAVARFEFAARSIAIAGDRLVAIGSNAKISIFSIREARLLETMTTYIHSPVVASPDGSRFAWFSYGVHVHELALNTTRLVAKTAKMPVAFTADGKRLATAIDGHTFVAWWDV